MTGITLHSIPGSPFLRSVQVALEEKGVSYAVKPMTPADMRGEEHLARHPFGRMPIFEQDGYLLYETQAILRYADQVFPEPSLTPADPRARARMNQVIGIIEWYFFPKAAAPIGFNRVIGPALIGLTPDEAAIAEAMPMATTSIAEFDRLLGDHPFFGGDAFSLADIMLGAQLDLFRYSPEGAQLLEGTTGLRDWLDRVRARPSMQAAPIPAAFTGELDRAA
jgi:glutathione S-transferase